jgi:nucleotide-binding universal stress UspA family protein
VVHAWQVPLSLSLPDPTIAGYAPVKAEDLDRLAEQLAAGAKQLVAGEIQPVLGDDPGVEVQQDVFEADAAGALVEASRGAELLVVGSRGRGGFTGLLLGSVGQQVAHHAHCPMVIVPHGRDR